SGGWAFALSPDGKTLATGDQYKVRLWDARTGQELRAFDLPDDYYAGSLRFTGGRHLVVLEAPQIRVSQFFGTRPAVSVLSIETGQRRTLAKSGFESVEVVADGKRVVASGM